MHKDAQYMHTCQASEYSVMQQGYGNAMAYNVSHVCDVALSPTRAKGHVAERRAAAPRSPRRPAGAPMHIRAVIRSCAVYQITFYRLETQNNELSRRPWSSTCDLSPVRNREPYSPACSPADDSNDMFHAITRRLFPLQSLLLLVFHVTRVIRLHVYFLRETSTSEDSL